MFKRFVVEFLYISCEVFDNIPIYSFYKRRWYRRGELGCFMLISTLAAKLEEKWKLV